MCPNLDRSKILSRLKSTPHISQYNKLLNSGFTHRHSYDLKGPNILGQNKPFAIGLLVF